MRIFKLMLMLLMCFSLSITVFADDNATTGDGQSGNAVAGKGYYLGSEYMYKVSVYVGLSDKANETHSLDNFKMIGDRAIYVKPSNFSLPGNLLRGLYSKVEYLNGQQLTMAYFSGDVITDNPPPPPITNDGNITAVKSYFGDTETLNAFIDAFAVQKGTTREDLVSNIYFTIDGVTKKYPPEEILPVKVNGQYRNKVAWVIIYEPVIISYLNDGIRLAFTATEYALAQKLGYFEFRCVPGGQYISGMTERNLPNSIVLEESWFGYPVIPALPVGVYWDLDRIVQGGGWGMRLLRPNGTNHVENNTAFDHEYRTDTDVITSVRIYASGGRITPDNPAYVTLTVNGQSSTTTVTIPSGGSQLVWLKWHTPGVPQNVNISVSVNGNSSARIDGSSRSKTLTVKVVDLNEKIPPNPTANDKKPGGFSVPSVPVKAQKTYASWGVWNCYWKPNWVWESDWDWVSDGEGGGYWVDNGEWVDRGDWEYYWTSYYASLAATMSVQPDAKVPTAAGKTMKSGYGINLNVKTTFYSDAPSLAVTGAQNVLSYYPEFNYETYLRLSDMVTGGYNAEFKLKPNEYSTYGRRVHFTPLWFPDARYEPYAMVIDAWTPDGMLSCNLSDYVNIQGNLYDDWHIGPLR